MNINLEQLLALPIFYGIKEKDLPILLKCLGTFQKKYAKDEIIILESNEVRNVGVIISGTVHMIKEDMDGNKTFFAVLGAGEFLGESFSCGSCLAARVSFVAASSCTILFLPFYKMMHACKMTCVFHHRLIENTVRLISDKNVQLMNKIEIISKKTLRAKILAYLHLQAELQNAKDFTIPLTRIELANYLCADRTAVARELSSMKRSGLIDYDGNLFHLL